MEARGPNLTWEPNLYWIPELKEEGKVTGAPVVATFRNAAWAVWRDSNLGLLYSSTTGGKWNRSSQLGPADDRPLHRKAELMVSPGLCPLSRELHVLAEANDGSLVHFMWGVDPRVPADTWDRIKEVPPAWVFGMGGENGALLLPADRAGLADHVLATAPRMVAFAPANGPAGMIAVYSLADGAVYVARYPFDEQTPIWTRPVRVQDHNLQMRWTGGLVVAEGRLRLTGFHNADNSLADWVCTPNPGLPNWGLDVWVRVGNTICLSAQNTPFLTNSGCSIVRVPNGALMATVDTNNRDVITILWSSVAPPAASFAVADPRPFTWRVICTTPAASDLRPAIGTSGNRVFIVFTTKEGWIERRSVKIAKAILPDVPEPSIWMSKIADGTPISQLTIPGTHDSCAISMVPIAGCQDLSIADQLRLGIRYFDIRGGWGDTNRSNEIVAHHGVMAIKVDNRGTYLPLRQVFQTMRDFVTTPPTNREGLIVQIKCDSEVWGNATDFWAQVWQFMGNAQVRDARTGQFKPLWRMSNTLPTMGDLRGCIQVVSRLGGTRDQGPPVPPPPNIPAPFGINLAAPRWTGNPRDLRINLPGGWYIRLQDLFNVNQLPEEEMPTGGWTLKAAQNWKWTCVRTLIYAAYDILPNTANAWFLNFASATAAAGAAGPWIIARNTDKRDPLTGQRTAINYRLRDLFEGVRARRAGTICMDFPQEPEDLVPCLLRSNYEH